MDKQAIFDRRKVLDAELDLAAEAAREFARGARQREFDKQNMERSRLQRECEATSGHLFVGYDYDGRGPVCHVCGCAQTEPVSPAAHNLTKFQG